VVDHVIELERVDLAAIKAGKTLPDVFLEASELLPVVGLTTISVSALRRARSSSVPEPSLEEPTGQGTNAETRLVRDPPSPGPAPVHRATECSGFQTQDLSARCSAPMFWGAGTSGRAATGNTRRYDQCPSLLQAPPAVADVMFFSAI
jgi:hypothetical protein